MDYAERVEELEREGLTTSDAQAVVDAESIADEAPGVEFTATYSPMDNKLRLTCSHRLDPETYARVKAAGYSWAPKQGIFVAPMWTPSREDLALELAGVIEDEDGTPEQRAAERAERFTGYSGKRASEAMSARDSVDRIAGGIPFGQPILIGHHSQRRAERDAQKIENGMRKAVNLWETAQYWQGRAAGALAHAKYLDKPEVRARRIKKLQTDQRRMLKATAERDKMLALWNSPEPLTMERALAITNTEPGYMSFCFTLEKYPRAEPASQYEGAMSLWSALSGGVITPEQAKALAVRAYTAGNANRARWVAHYENRLAYETAMLGEQGREDLIAPKARPKQLPLVNYRQESFTLASRYRRGESETLQQVEITSEQYACIHSENRGTREVGGSHRIRVGRVEFDATTGKVNRWPSMRAPLVAVFLTDSKTHAKPAPIEPPEPTPPAPRPTVEKIETAHANPVRMEQASMFDAMRDSLKGGVQVAVAAELFPTPQHLAERMVEECGIEHGHRVLEPSAGTGRLIGPLGSHSGGIVAVEQNRALADGLRRDFPLADVHCCDFMEWHDTQGFDRIVMNPPFAKQADIDHVRHAFGMLNKGGRLVAIMSAGVDFRQDRKATAFRALIEEHGGTIEPLPADTFKASGTSVNTVLITLDK